MSVKNNKVKNTLNLMRHSERSEESMDPSVGVASLKDDNRMGQRGRSMVEMLGVLAIVGVLSVGGVYGYGVAMKKHKANELLHRASMLATTISAQAMTNDGKLPETVTTFGNSSYGTFSNTVGETTDKTGFTITISEMDSAVCTQLEKMAGGMVREATCDDTTATLTYYKNLATTEAEGAKSPTGEKPDPACVDVECPVAGTACVNGSCLCSDGRLPCNEACCGEGEICTAPGGTSGQCKELTCDETDEDCCVTNADCGETEFCLFTSYTSATDAETTCPVPANGVCTALTGDYAPKVVENTEEPLYGVTYSGAKMNWWSASNWCQANGSSLMSLATLNTLSGDSDDSRKTALQGGLGMTSARVWLEDAESSIPCNVLVVYSGSIFTGSRNNGSHYAVCR